MPDSQQLIADAHQSGEQAMQSVTKVIASLSNGLKYSEGIYRAIPYLPEIPKAFHYWQARRHTRTASTAVEEFVLRLSALDLEHTGEFRLGLKSQDAVRDIFGSGTVDFFLNEELFLEGQLAKSRISANVALSRLRRAVRALDGSAV